MRLGRFLDINDRFFGRDDKVAKFYNFAGFRSSISFDSQVLHSAVVCPRPDEVVRELDVLAAAAHDTPAGAEVGAEDDELPDGGGPHRVQLGHVGADQEVDGGARSVQLLVRQGAEGSVVIQFLFDVSNFKSAVSCAEVRNTNCLNVISVAISIFNWDFVERSCHPGFATVCADEDKTPVFLSTEASLQSGPL